MLEMVSQLLCPDLVVLKVVGPPDRSLVRDAAGIRPGDRPARTLKAAPVYGWPLYTADCGLRGCHTSRVSNPECLQVLL